MNIIIVAFHPCYCSEKESFEINISEGMPIPRIREQIRLIEFLSETPPGKIGELIDEGGMWFVDNILHGKISTTMEVSPC